MADPPHNEEEVEETQPSQVEQEEGNFIFLVVASAFAGNAASIEKLNELRSDGSEQE